MLTEHYRLEKYENVRKSSQYTYYTFIVITISIIETKIYLQSYYLYDIKSNFDR